MTGRGFEEGFERVLAMESLAEKYRDVLRRRRRAQERQKYPFVVLVWNFLVYRLGRLLGSSETRSGLGAGRPGASLRPEGFLALDAQKASERKDLYVREERIAVYTSFFGAYDQLREPLMHPDNIDYFIVTDQAVPEGSLWKRVPLQVVPDGLASDPILANRWCKMHPHLLFPEYAFSVYVDANIWVLSDLTPLTAGLGRFPVAMFRHKKRDCVYAEVEAAIRQGKGAPEALQAHEALLRSHGVPTHWGLLEASVIARRHQDPVCVELMEAWWESFSANSRRDQISLIDCLWLKGIQPSAIGILGDNLQRCNLFLQMHHKVEGVAEPGTLEELLALTN
ncbi:MAG: DUF616 domain-containing protein [Bacteroidales bacterium]|nr:DUF616 domain-containing protein [Bacteroidales bacterium]